MNSKLSAVGTITFGFGALIGWALAADHYEKTTKSNRLLLSEMIRRQGKELNELHAEKTRRSMDPLGWESVDPEAVAIQAARAEEQMRLRIVEQEVMARHLEKQNIQNGGEIDAVPSGDGVEILAEIAEVESAVETDPEISTEAIAAEEAEAELVLNETAEETRTNLQRLIDSYTADPDEVDRFVSRASKVIEHSMETPPFVISRDIYSWDEDEGDAYAKITLTYYERDRVLVDEDEDLIEEIDDYVGWRNLSQFGGESGDPDTVFIRNRRLLTDFEVVRETDDDPPVHIRYGMSRDEFATNKAAGVIKFRDTDRD